MKNKDFIISSNMNNKRVNIQFEKIETTIKFFIIFSLFLIAYAPLFPQLFFDWMNDPNYSHGLLIPFISLYFIWQKRDIIRGTELGSSVFGIFFIIFGLVLYFVGIVGSEFFLMRSSIIITLWGLILYLCGSKLAKHLVFPVFFLIFMVPLPYIIYNSFAFPLKLFVSEWAIKLAQALKITAIREGNVIYLPMMSMEVADACSGLRSLMSLFALGTILAYLSHKGYLRKIIFILCIIPIAVFTNILRVSGTAMLAYHFGPAVAEGFIHEFSGLVTFALAFILLITIFIMLEKSFRKIS